MYNQPGQDLMIPSLLSVLPVALCKVYRSINFKGRTRTDKIAALHTYLLAQDRYHICRRLYFVLHKQYISLFRSFAVIEVVL